MLAGWKTSMMEPTTSGFVSLCTCFVVHISDYTYMFDQCTSRIELFYTVWILNCHCFNFFGFCRSKSIFYFDFDNKSHFH